MNKEIPKIERIEDYDVSFMIMELPGIENKWVCAYVNLKGKLEEDYSNGTFREGNVIGVDTNHYHNSGQDLYQRYLNAKAQITSIIKEHEELKNEF